MLVNSGTDVDLNLPPGRLAKQINIADIAHSLSLVNKFNGHTASPYSVAEHSFFCSRIIQQMGRADLEIHALLHDAHEAYTGDITRPVQEYLGARKLNALQFKIQVAIYLNLGLYMPNQEDAKVIKAADDEALRTEISLFFAKKDDRHGAPWQSVKASWLQVLDERIKTLPNENKRGCYE